MLREQQIFVYTYIIPYSIVILQGENQVIIYITIAILWVAPMAQKFAISSPDLSS